MRGIRAGAAALAAASALLLAAGGVLGQEQSTDGPGPAASPLADLAWLAGNWALERPGEQLDERWGPPVGNSMAGHFRWVRDGELWLTELLTITEEAGEVYFRLRHFGARMTPWEAENDALEYRLTERAAGRAVFDIIEPRTGRPDRFVFEAPAPDSLVVRLEGGREAGPAVQVFGYGAARR